MGLEQKLPRMYSCIHTAGLPENRCYLCQSILMGNFKPIGGAGSGFTTGGNNNIYSEHEFKDAKGYALNERYDFSKHNKMLPHLNQSVDNLNLISKFGTPKPDFNSGRSNKTDDKRFKDGYKGLGDAHSTLLFCIEDD